MPSCVCGPVTVAPPTVTAPLVGFSRPAMIRSSVLLPQPLGPSNETNSPASTVKATSASASTDPVLVQYELADAVDNDGFARPPRVSDAFDHRLLVHLTA